MSDVRCRTKEVSTSIGNGSAHPASSNPYVRTFACFVLALSLLDIGQAATFAVAATQDIKDVNLKDNLCGTATGTCTLRAAIEQSNFTQGKDTISLPAGNYVLTLGELVIEDNLDIRGQGAGTIRSDGTIAGKTIIDGNKKSRVFLIGLDLLVCDTINDSVLRYGGQTGRFIATFVPSGSGGLDLPLAGTLGPGNDLFVGGFSSGVHRYDSTTGNSKGGFTASSNGASLEPTDLGFFLNKLFVADFLRTNFLPPGSIARFDEGTNAFIGFIPPGSGGLASPNSIALDFTQNLTSQNRFALYVTNVGPDEVLRYDFNTGAFIDKFVSGHSGGLSRARGLAFGPDGNLYVASELNDRILRYDGRTGAFIDVFVAVGSGGLNRPTGLTFGPDSNLYVLSRSSSGQREVLRFDGKSGAFIDTFIPAGRGGLGSAGCLLFARGVGTGPTVNIRGVTIQNGMTSVGGGILISKGSALTLAGSIVNDNRANNSGGGIYNEGTLAVTASTITRNAAPFLGGGGIKNVGGTAILKRSTVDNNSATGGGFTGGGGIENLGGTVTINNGTISGNKLTGGVASNGGGVRNAQGATLNLLNVTIAKNGGPATKEGGGISNISGSTVNLANTIIDRNFVGGQGAVGPDCLGTLTSAGFNVISNATNCNIVGNTNGNKVTSAQLASLAANGGPTRTQALCTGVGVPDGACSGVSPAIDNGDNAVCPNTDQRNFRRPVDGPDLDSTATCDIGAFEAFSFPVP